MARVSHTEIINVLRDRIVQGKFEPRSRIPTRPQIEYEFGASIATVQKALGQLARDGFVVARGRSGTFVTERPPHLYRVGVLLPGPQAPQLHEALRRVVDEATPGSPYRLQAYRAHAETGGQDAEALFNDIRNRRLAGLICGHPINALPLPEGVEHLPCVQLGDRPSADAPMVTWSSILPRAAEWLAQRGRSRVAVLRPSRLHRSDQESHRASVSRAMQTVGLRAQDRLLVAVQADAPDTTRAAVRLLMGLPEQDQPDAIVVMDDRIAGPATEMLQTLDLEAPHDLDVVVASYFPRQVPLAMSVTRIGCDVPAAVSAALTLISRQQQGQSVGPVTQLPALLEHECLAASGGMPATTTTRAAFHFA